MPSPFPGMDPYLEGDLWQEFHDRLANQISEQLLPKVGPKYVALLAKRYVLDSPALGVFDAPSPPRVVYPDVHVVTPAQQSGGVATLEAVITPPTAEIPSPMLAPHLSVEIRDVAERRLVTVIEILSPSNKVGEGARDYNERRNDLLQTRTHLLEIDLVRTGTRITLMEPVPPAPYYVYLSRTERRPFTLVWAVQLPQRLPTVPVPLLRPDPDVALDVQAALTAAFNLVGYERLIDYTAPPPPPDLSPDESAWLQAQLQAAEKTLTTD